MNIVRVSKVKQVCDSIFISNIDEHQTNRHTELVRMTFYLLTHIKEID